MSASAPVSYTHLDVYKRQVRPYTATYRFDTTDAQIVRPYTATYPFDTTDAQTVRPYTATYRFDTTDAQTVLSLIHI